MGLFGKSKKELKKEALEEECRILNEKEDLLNKYPIGKAFKYLEETVWVVDIVPYKVEYGGLDEYYKTEPKIIIQFWTTYRFLQKETIKYKDASKLLKEIL